MNSVRGYLTYKRRNLIIFPLPVEETTWSPNPISTFHIWAPVQDKVISDTNTNLSIPSIFPTLKSLDEGGWGGVYNPSFIRKIANRKLLNKTFTKG